MITVLLAVVIAAALLGLGRLLLGRSRTDDEVERFHRARQMTTDWARAGVTQPVFADELSDEDRERQREQQDA